MDDVLLGQIIIWLVPLGYLLGVSAAIVWPYVNAKKENPDMVFDWSYATWQIGFGIVGLVPTILAANTLSDFALWAAQGWIGVFLAIIAGFGAARVGREGQKTRGK